MPASEHLDTFQRRVRRVRQLLDRQLRLESQGLVPKTEVEGIYELGFLNIFVSFENEIYELLKSNMLTKYASTGHRRSLIVPENRAIAEKILMGTSRYVQLLPVEQMEKVARVYLKNGVPFTLLTPQNKGSLKTGYAIRNHIAHRSAHSKANYKRVVFSNTLLPRNSSVPGYYLRSQLTRTITYFDHHVAEIAACLKHLCDNT